jgi:hypothetical protein
MGQRDFYFILKNPPPANFVHLLTRAGCKKAFRLQQNDWAKKLR